MQISEIARMVSRGLRLTCLNADDATTIRANFVRFAVHGAAVVAEFLREKQVFC